MKLHPGAQKRSGQCPGVAERGSGPSSPVARSAADAKVSERVVESERLASKLIKRRRVHERLAVGLVQLRPQIVRDEEEHVLAPCTRTPVLRPGDRREQQQQ